MELLFSLLYGEFGELLIPFVWALSAVVVTYFSVGMFTHRLDNECSVRHLLGVLHVGEFFFWPWHISLAAIWKRRWREDFKYRVEIIGFLSVLSFLILLYPVLSNISDLKKAILAFASMWGITGFSIYALSSIYTNNKDEVFSDLSFWIWPLVGIAGPLGFRMILKIASRNFEFMQARP